MGLAAIVLGVAHAVLAYYATKNGAELERASQALLNSGLAIAAGLFLLLVSQLSRVLVAIEENTRFTAFHMRFKLKDPATYPTRRSSSQD